jgi:hypothetical protein
LHTKPDATWKKPCSAHQSVLLYFSCPSWSLSPALLSVENWVPLKPVIEACGMLYFFIIPYAQTQLNWVCIAM